MDSNHAKTQSQMLCEFCEQLVDVVGDLQRIEIVREGGGVRVCQLCEGCIDTLEYAK